MPWPKGVKRVGYIRKDGKAHNKKGEGRAQGPRITIVQPRVIKEVKLMVVSVDAKPALHGAGNRPVIEVCPNCSYAYADGGYCESCGWTQYRSDCNHCTSPKGKKRG